MYKSELAYILYRLSCENKIYLINVNQKRPRRISYRFNNKWSIELDPESTNYDLSITSIGGNDEIHIQIDDITRIDVINLKGLIILRISVQKGHFPELGYKVLRLYDDGSYEFLEWGTRSD